jgi:hypothetical protein
MRKVIFGLIILILISLTNVSGQIRGKDTTGVLETLFGKLINNYNDEDRIRINDSISLIIDSYVRSDTVLNHSFRNLRYLGQIVSPDSALKIITWNLVLGSGPGRYYCYIIRKPGNQTKNRIYKLTASYREDQVSTDTVYGDKNWYGALYYVIKPYKVNESKCWILLGVDYGNPFISRKIIEVLSFADDDSLIFGKKWFATEGRLKLREVFEYASNGMMSLRFSSDSMIVFDHLVPFSPSQVNDRQYYGPDYSYDAYIYKDGLWQLRINVDARNKE